LTFIGDLACTEKRQNQFAKAWPLFAQSQKTDFPSFDPPYLEFARIRVENSSAQSLDENGYGMVVREKPFAEGLLREVTHARYFSTHTLPYAGAGYRCDLWVPLTDEPDNFVTLGSFLHKGGDFEYALARNKGLVGVHRSVCISGVLGSYVSIKVWRIAPQDDAIDIGAFVAHDSSKPQLPIWLLRKDVAELVEYSN
ncbi:12690_t:CDS:2, partial [Ambispora leptoticha]